MRSEYASTGLDETESGSDPFGLFDRWLVDAVSAGLTEPNAMALATADGQGVPSVRTVLLKGLNKQGAVFFTNYESRKGRELTQNPRAAAVMLWHDLGRQVRFEGSVSRLPEAESDAYFLSRPEGSRVSAIASPQSVVVADRSELEHRWNDALPNAGSRPNYWGGFQITIDSWEFWQGRMDRLHDRIRFIRAEDSWQRERLAP